MLKKDNVWIGILVGICIPVMAYGILLTLYDQMDTWGWLNNKNISANFRTRTLALLGIVCNLIPFTYYRKKRKDESMRGVIFPTIAFVIFWMIYFGRHLI